MNRKLKIYLDTSVVNFLYYELAPEFMAATIDFFENHLDQYQVFISEFVLAEINRTKNPDKRNQLLNALAIYDIKIYQKANDEIFELAKIYIDNGIIPQNKLEDALHIAFSTYYEFDILLSWNFKHLANVKKQMLINSVNLSKGYNKPLFLINPLEVLDEK